MTNMNTQEALEHYGINFDVNKVPALINLNGEYQLVPNVNAMVRSDDNQIISGVSVSDSYEVVQTHSYADIIEKVTGDLSADFVKGGTLKNGRLTYLQCKLPDTIRVKSTNDTIDKYLTFINSFDGSSRFMILPTLTRIVCENQMAALTREARASGLRFTHSRNVQERLRQADKAILDVMNAYRSFSVKIDWLADTKFTEAQMELATRKLFGVKDDVKTEDIALRTKKNIYKCVTLFEDGVGVAPFRGTAWGALNGFTEFSDHHRAMRQTTDKFESKLVGTGAQFKQRALQVIESIVNA